MARYDADKDEKKYRNYVADALKVITENTARRKTDHVMISSYADVIKPKSRSKADTRTAQEIADDIISKLGGKR